MKTLILAGVSLLAIAAARPAVAADVPVPAVGMVKVWMLDMPETFMLAARAIMACRLAGASGPPFVGRPGPLSVPAEAIRFNPV